MGHFIIVPKDFAWFMMQGILPYFISPEGLRVDLRRSFLLYLMCVIRWFGFTRLGYGILFGLSVMSVAQNAPSKG